MHLSKDLGQEKTFDNTTEVAMQPANPTRAPSQVFFGLTLISGVRPIAYIGTSNEDSLMAKYMRGIMLQEHVKGIREQSISQTKTLTNKKQLTINLMYSKKIEMSW